jgi:hypothetical protein
MWTIASSSSILAAMGMKSVWLSPLASILRREHVDDVDNVDEDRGRPTPSDSGWRLANHRPAITAQLAVGLRALMVRLAGRGSARLGR